MMSVFHWLDYTVFVVVLTVSIGTGIFFAWRGRKRNTKEDYLMANRSMKVIPVSISIFFSWTSAIAYLGEPVECYSYGLVYFMIHIGSVIAVPFLAYFVAPKFNSLNIISAYEYLETRYNYPFRILTSCVAGFATVLWMGLAILTTSMALSQVSDLPGWVSSILTGCVATFYTAVGGMRAVVWVDSLQLFVLAGGQLTMVVLVVLRMGGLGEVFKVAGKGGRINFMDTMTSFNPLSRASFWIFLVGGCFRVLTDYSYSQIMIQRYSTVKTQREARLVLLWNIPMFILLNFLLGFTGLMLFVMYGQCDPLLSGRIERRDQMVPLMIMDVLGHVPGISGLFLATVYCASLSTLSSGMNALAATTLSDLLEPLHKCLRRRPMTERWGIIWAKSLVFVFGVVVVSISFMIGSLGKTAFDFGGKIGTSSGPISALFLMGLLFPRIKPLFVEVGFIVSLVICLSLACRSITVPDTPPRELLPLSTVGCNTTASSSLMNASFAENSPFSYTVMDTFWEDSSTTMTTATLHTSGGSFQWSDLLHLNPLMYSVLGIAITVVVSCLLQLLYYIIQYCKNVFKKPRPFVTPKCLSVNLQQENHTAKTVDQDEKEEALPMIRLDDEKL